MGGDRARAQVGTAVEMRVKGVSLGSVVIPVRMSVRGAECAHVRRVNQRGMGVGIRVCVRESA